MELLRSDSRLESLIILSDMVHTGMEVCRMDLKMSGLVEQPWLQLMCCAIYLPYSRNFTWWKECYNLRLGSGCNLGEDLREERGLVQLVKHKEYRILSMLIYW